MPVLRLDTRRVEKPWGRRDLPGFEPVPDGAPPVGEIWFEVPEGAGVADPALLVKYLFTAEHLSVQVHPDDTAARAAGYPRGKSEAWRILSADPGATIALGTVRPLTRDELRAAAENGSIEGLLSWKPVLPGEFWSSPAGTVHAIGAGLVVIELQQNVDLTYRLYDYGSDRELHLDAGVAAADPVPYVAPFRPRDLAPGRRLLQEGGAFVAERWTGARAGTLAATAERPVWLVPIAGRARAGDEALAAAGVWLATEAAALAAEADADLLVMYEGEAAVPDLLGT